MTTTTDVTTAPSPTPAAQVLNFLTAFGSDAKLVNEGRWVGYPTADSPFKFLIARVNNRAQRATASRLMLAKADVFKAADKGDAERATADEAILDLEAEVMGISILKGWTNNIVIGKKPLGEYSAEKAKQLLAEYIDFRTWVEEQATDNEGYKMTVAEEEEAVKN